ncbi:MAG: hypothetical protein ABIT36_07875 [Steroidobacteraceae bacterium]
MEAKDALPRARCGLRRHSSGHYAAFVAWLRAPLAALLVVLLLITLCTHLPLGLRVVICVVIEDYVHCGAQIAALIAVRFA